MTAEIIPFNPLDKRNLGASVADALLASQPYKFSELLGFPGSGVYAIYYSGSFPAYCSLAAVNRGALRAPIYVGKAVPSGARKGGVRDGSGSGKSLFTRLRQHADSIKATSNLDINDFRCRLLVVDDIWIPLGESLLIARFSPLWNQLVDGFGNHDPGSGRHAGLCPRWDVLHPGRPWAAKLKERPETAAEISRDVQQYLKNHPILGSIGQKLALAGAAAISRNSEN
jgi:hypothetical protein